MAFPHWATPSEIAPLRGAALRSLTCHVTEILETQQAELAELLQPELVIIVSAFSLELHAPEPHTDPGVKPPKAGTTISKVRGEVVRSSPDNSVEFRDDLLVQVMTADGDFSDFVFELLH